MVPPVELIWRNVLPTPSPVQNLCYVPRVNALLCSSKDGTLSMHTAYSGSLICSSLIEGSRRSDKGNILLQYFEPRDSIVIARGGLFNVRRRFEEVFLISDILEPPVKDPTDRVRLELTPHQASVFKSALNSGDNNFETFEKAGLRVISSENLPRLNNWPALILEGPYDVLASCVQHMLHMSQTNNSPLAQLAAAINSRLFRSILSDEVLTSLCYWQTKILMNIEQYRRISFCVWPHMDYQWATPEAMAAAGFYKMAMDTGDRVFCFLCDICLTNWEPTDEPWSEHNRHASHCPFVQSKSSSNVPIIGYKDWLPAIPYSTECLCGYVQFKSLQTTINHTLGAVAVVFISRRQPQSETMGKDRNIKAAAKELQILVSGQ